MSFYRPTATRHKILWRGGAFPSNQYAVKSQILFQLRPGIIVDGVRPYRRSLPARRRYRSADRPRRKFDRHRSAWRGVNYVTGQAFDIAAMTEAGHEKGCIVGFDLAHAAGNIPLRLQDWRPDFAVWCNYKYLNGGPGSGRVFRAPAAAHAWNIPRFAGWWGHDEKTRFQDGSGFPPNGRS